MRNKKALDGSLKEVKTAGYKWSKREKNINRRAGLHDKKKELVGESRVKRRKPLALKHVRRMRKAAVVLSCVVVGGSVAAGVGFLREPEPTFSDKLFKTVCYELPDPAKDPTEYTLVETVGFMNYVLQNQDFWSSSMSSTVNALGFKQTVQNYKQYYENITISADIAEGFSQKASQTCVIADKGVVLWRQSANKKFNGMDTQWSTADAEGCTVDEFREARGLPPNEFSVYVLNEKTIANAQDYSVSANGDGTYTMSLVLNCNQSDDEYSADYYYKQQMKITGDLSNQPAIKSTTLTYTFDSKWRVLAFTIDDEYTALGMPCTSHTDVKYSYAEDDAKNSFYDDYFKKYEMNYAQAENPDEASPNPLDYITGAFTPILTDGAVLNLDLKFDELELNGSIFIALKDGALSDVRAQLGDIYIMIDEDMTLYIADGNAKYKLAIGSMLASASAEEQTSGGLDPASLIDELTSGEFTLSETNAVLKSKLNLFGLEISVEFNFSIDGGVIGLNYLYAEIPFNGKTITARAVYGTDDQIPAKPQDMSQFRDILNGGIALDIALDINDLSIDGIAHIIMNEGRLGGAYAQLGDLSVYYDCPANMLYLTDGNVKYKLALSYLAGADFDLGALDINGLLGELIGNVSASDGKISTALTLEILEQTISAVLGVNLTGGISVEANLGFADNAVNARISLSDREFTAPDLSGYDDILNTGVTFGVSLKIDNLQLDGNVQIVLSDGKFTELRADFTDFAVYYIAKTNALYVTDGNVKYFVDLTAQGRSGAVDMLGRLDIKAVVKELIENLTVGKDGAGTNIQLNLLNQIVSAGVNVTVNGGLQVDASLEVGGLPVNLNVKPKNAEVALPDLSEYVDLLNTGVTFNVSVAVDGLKLDGKLQILLKGGKLTEVRADFGDIQVFYISAENELYIKVGESKVFVPLSQSETDALDMSQVFDLSAVFGDLSQLVGDLLNNIVTGTKELSVNAQLKIFDSVLPAGVSLNIQNGISVSVNATAFGIDLTANVSLTGDEIPALENREEYINVLENAWDLVDGLLGEHISANVSGTVYSYAEEYNDYNNIKYNFTATAEYDKGNTENEDGATVSNRFPVHINAGNRNEEGRLENVSFYVDGTLYLHFNVSLTAVNPADDSIYMDLWLFDADPVSSTNGVTDGAISRNGELDVYLKISKYAQNGEPLCVYAPVSEIMSILSMAGAVADLHSLSFENSAELTQLVADVADIVDQLLIDNYIKETKDQFASLGGSLIPQILGVNLNELLNKLLGSAGDKVEEANGFKIDFSKEYVKGVTYSENNLEIKLNSAEVFGIENGEDLVLSLAKTQIGGIDYISAISADNIYMGATEKLDIRLGLDYGEITRPETMSGYINLSGADALLQALVNSASHKTETGYDLNHYYLINGQINASLSIIGIDVDIAVNINSASIFIDPVTNEVSADVHLSYAGKKVLVEAICGTSDVYLTIRDGMVYIKRIQTTNSSNKAITPVTITRVIPVSDFLSPAQIMDHISFIFNFGSVIADELAKIDMNGGSGTGFAGKDIGALVNYILSSYTYSETDEQAQWTISIKGGDKDKNNGILTDAVGMKMSDIPVTFVADKNADGTLTVKRLNIAGAGNDRAQMDLATGISLKFYGILNYVNPCSESEEESDDSEDISTVWLEAFDCKGNEIPKTELWGRVLGLLGKDYIEITASDNSSPVKLGQLTYKLDGKEFAQGKQVLYTNREVLSAYAEPAWTQKNGYTVATSFDPNTVSVNASYVANTYKIALDFGELAIPRETVDYTYATDLDLTAYLGKIYADGNGDSWRIAGFEYNGVAYNGENPVISKEILAEIYRNDVTISVICEEMENDTATHVTLNSTVSFGYTGYDGLNTLLSLDFEDGANYGLSEATAEGYTFLGWWYDDNGAWRKVTSVSEFAVEGKASFVTLEALWIKVGINAVGSVPSKNNYKVEVTADYSFEGNGSLTEVAELSGISYSWQSYSWGSWSNRGSANYTDNISLMYTDSASSNAFNKYEKWKTTVEFTVRLTDGTEIKVQSVGEGNF